MGLEVLAWATPAQLRIPRTQLVMTAYPFITHSSAGRESKYLWLIISEDIPPQGVENSSAIH
jgi:hypothetical protein